MIEAFFFMIFFDSPKALVLDGIYWSIGATTVIFVQALSGASHVTQFLVAEGPQNGGLSSAD